MKRFFLAFLFFGFLFFNFSYSAFAKENSSLDLSDLKQRAFAYYATGNYKEAGKILEDFPKSEKDETIYLILSNIAQENNDDNLAISNLNRALDKNYSFYKAYYNLGCIFANKKSYLLALNNFELAIKYNKNFAPAYYNLANCQMILKDFKSAKKNLIKALELEPNNKDAVYNLAYCYKQLNQAKNAKKTLEVYNKMP